MRIEQGEQNTTSGTTIKNVDTDSNVSDLYDSLGQLQMDHPPPQFIMQSKNTTSWVIVYEYPNNYVYRRMGVRYSSYDLG